MEYSFFIGVDISKLTLDAAAQSGCSQLGNARHFANTDEGLQNLWNWARDLGAVKKSTLICAEHTGVYENTLEQFCGANHIPLCMESPLRIKRSMGLVRGKNDRIDAAMIARYAFEHKDSIKLYHPANPDIEAISALLRERRTYVQQKTALLSARSELRRFDSELTNSRRDAVIASLEKTVTSVETQLRMAIKKNSEIKKNYDLISSVVGIGMITAAETIVYTNNFKNFENPRQYASYIGIAPFDHTSGTSVNGRTSVSNLCRRQLKTSITMAARTAILNDPWLHQYYQRKMKEKGNVRSQHGVVLNAVKFKLVLRMFSVIKSGVPYKVMNF